MSKPHKATPLNLFLGRLFREGKLQAFNKELQARIELIPAGLPNNQKTAAIKQAKNDLAVSMGYQGPRAERELQRVHLASAEIQIHTAVERRTAMALGISKSMMEWEDAVASLPPKADMQIQHDWINAHPAMSRKCRQKDNTEPLRLTADDILHARHGPCPSAHAANLLQNWADSPAEWKKFSASLIKKPDSQDGGANNEVVEDVELGEVERLLKEVSAA